VSVSQDHVGGSLSLQPGCNLALGLEFKGPVQSSLLTLFGLNLDLNWSRLV